MNNCCRICNNITNKLTNPKTSTTYNFCSVCEFIGIDKKYKLSSEQELEIYNQHENSINDPRYVAFFEKFISAAILPYKKSGTVFDFGSGPSPVLAKILERDYSYEVDIYDLFYSPKKTYEGKQYDLITCTEVVEHLENPIFYFKLFSELIKPGGIISIMTLFHTNNPDEFFDWWYIRDKTHISFYTLNTMKKIAEMFNFELIYTNNKRYTTFKKL